MKKGNSNMENRRAKQPNVKASWIWEGCEQTSFKDTRTIRKKGARKINQIKWKRECDLTRGWWRQTNRNMESWKGTQKKTITIKNEKRRRVVKKRLWGEEKSKMSYIAGHSSMLCITDRKTRPKTARIAEKTRLFVIIWKQHIRHIRLRKGMPRKTTRQRKNTKIMKTSTTEKKNWRSQMKGGTWVSKRDVREFFLKRQQKKGKTSKKWMMEEKQHQNVLSKELHEEIGKKNK